MDTSFCIQAFCINFLSQPIHHFGGLPLGVNPAAASRGWSLVEEEAPPPPRLAGWPARRLAGPLDFYVWLGSAGSGPRTPAPRPGPK